MSAMQPPDGLRRRAAVTLRPWRRAVLARRRPLAAVCAALAAVVGLHALAEPAAPTTRILVAARDLPVGSVLDAADLTDVRVAPDDVPAGIVADPVGRSLAAPVRQGEPVTDVRLVGADLLAGRADLVALPVRLPDAAMAGLLRVGDTIDLLAADPQGDTAITVAPGAVVLTVPAPGDPAASGPSGLAGRLVVLGVRPDLVDPVSQSAVRDYLTFAWSG